MRVGDLRFETALWSFPPGIILGIYLSIFGFLASTLSSVLALRRFPLKTKKVTSSPILSTHKYPQQIVSEGTSEPSGGKEGGGIGSNLDSYLEKGLSNPATG